MGIIIPDKKTFSLLANQGRCGNTPKNWDNLVQCYSDDEYWDRGNGVSVCVSGPPMSHFRKYHQTIIDVMKWSVEKKVKGERGETLRQNQLYAYENPPKDLQENYDAFQGEYWAHEDYLLWSRTNQPLGKIKRAGLMTEERGPAARLILRIELGHELDELDALEEKYPGSAVEFTRFGWPCGIFRRKLLIWEVRHF